jgi:hypothetical protein
VLLAVGLLFAVLSLSLPDFLTTSDPGTSSTRLGLWQYCIKYDHEGALPSRCHRVDTVRCVKSVCLSIDISEPPHRALSSACLAHPSRSLAVRGFLLSGLLFCVLAALLHVFRYGASLEGSPAKAVYLLVSSSVATACFAVVAAMTSRLRDDLLGDSVQNETDTKAHWSFGASFALVVTAAVASGFAALVAGVGYHDVYQATRAAEQAGAAELYYAGTDEERSGLAGEHHMLRASAGGDDDAKMGQ